MTPGPRVSRPLVLPDPLRVDRARRLPELGPRLLFFSGGSALRRTSRALKRLTHNSIHLITAFDSGGSSATLRRAFGVLSVGDLRNRLMALADESVRGNPEIYRLFSYRFSTDEDRSLLEARLHAMIAGSDVLIADVPSPMRRLIRTYLKIFREHMTDDFDLRGASIGNLVLVGGWLNNDQDIDSVVFLFSKLVEVRGTVLPVVDGSLHLAADLRDGSTVVGQHLFGAKQAPPLPAPIERLRLVRALDDPSPAAASIHDKVRSLIASADLVCFPVGSFYSSVVANLLPQGVGRAVAQADCPKVYVPNTGRDPEQAGHTIYDCVTTLLAHLRADAGRDTPTHRLLDFVLVDQASGAYAETESLARVADLGVRVLETDLGSSSGAPELDGDQLAEALVSFV